MSLECSSADDLRVDGFEGLTNLRDLGGHLTDDGRRVRRGLVYRSESLDYVSARDSERLLALGVRSICDLRGARESALHPPRVPGAVHHRLPSETHFEEITGQAASMAAGTIDAHQMSRFMQRIYDALPRLAAPHLATIASLILDTDAAPVLFHCTAGKDRTGFAAAVLLKLLGVSWSSIESDYLLTSEVWRPRFALPPQLSTEAQQVALGTHPQWLARSFAVIEQEHGGFARYLVETVGLSDTLQQALRDRLLQDE